ncbi:SPFH domain-containing protein [uncultured Streptomyces sp.]|uniref:SPFH domain-containing protein n=1 Tax=uncultured Streptomyces sp. TaxID=174707 RepID=UPI00261CD969|nr:SPFH domain-containing protein [uncultured Streptomyces sp.]
MDADGDRGATETGGTGGPDAAGGGVPGGAGGGEVPGGGPHAPEATVVDMVLDLTPGEAVDSSLRAASATVSVPVAGGASPVRGATAVPAPAGTPEPAPDRAREPAPGQAPESARGRATEPPPDRIGAPDRARAPAPDRAPLSGGDRAPQSSASAGSAGSAGSVGSAEGSAADLRWAHGRRQAVIGSETTASIPVHLLFRDDPGGAAHPRGAGLFEVGGPREGSGPLAVTRPGPGPRRPAPGARRPPVPRDPRVQAPTRPSPAADPRLSERPGPALPGWAALFTGLLGTAAGLAVLWWCGALPAAALAGLHLPVRPDGGIGIGYRALLALLVLVVIFAFGGLGRGRVGHAGVLTLFGDYRGTVRRTGLLWVSPLLLRRRVDVRLRHWRSEPLPAVDADGTALRVVVLVVWRVRDTARAVLGVADHERYLRQQVEAAMARVLSQLPADAFHDDAPTLRDAEAVGDALTRMLKADCEPVGVEVYSAQPTGIEYAPEVAAAMQRRRVAALDARHRDSVLTSVVDAVDDTVSRLTARGLVELDDYERKALVKDLTVAFYTGRAGAEGG